jgi:multidrug/hemolysin transport system permease protein
MQTIALIVFASVLNSRFVGFICSFFSRNSAFSAASILIGTIIGFINGLYVPLGSLGKAVSNALCAFPTLHFASLFRGILTENAVDLVFKNAPALALEEYKYDYGLMLKFGDDDIGWIFSIVFVVVVSAISLAVMIFNLRRKREEI